MGIDAQRALNLFKLKVKSIDTFAVLSAILIAVAVRVLVISSSPAFIPGGDTAGYVAYARELIANGFIIPVTNTTHFPGSLWVYPPLLPYFWAFLISMAGSSPIAPFYIIEATGLAIDSLTIIPIYLIAGTVFGRRTAIITAFLFTVYLPDLYALTWGGIPQLFATFLLAWVIYFTIRISRDTQKRWKYPLILGFTLTVLVFTHDLTSFVVLFVLVSIAALSFILMKFRIPGINPMRSHLDSLASRLPFSLLMAVPALAVWYSTRLQWVAYAGAPYLNSGLPGLFPRNITVFDTIFQGTYGYFSPLGYAIFLVPLFVYSFYICARRSPEKTGILLLFVILPIAMAVVEFRDPTVVARMGYYSFLPGLIITSYAISNLRVLKATGSAPGKAVRNVRQNGRRVAAALLIPIVVVSALGITENMQSHTFYNSTVEAQPAQMVDYAALNWISSNIPANSTFVSFGEMGYFIMGYDGNPTLVYQKLEYLTQPVEWKESMAAYSMVYQPTVNETLTHSDITLYGVNYVVAPDTVSVPSFYVQVYSSGDIAIYHVSR